MARIRVDNAGAVGLIEDSPEIELAPEGWSMLQNMRPTQNGLERMLGETKAFGGGSWLSVLFPTNKVLSLFPADSATEKFWLMAGTAEMFTRQEGPTFTLQRVTRAAAAYSATEDLKWNGIRFQGFIVLTNGVDEPQYWAPAVGTAFQNLSSIGTAPDKWPSNYVCRLLRNIGPYMIALDVTKAGTRNPYLVKWSSPALAGAMPPSWDETSAAQQANEYALVESNMPTGAGGGIIAAERLRNSLLIYKQNEFWTMDYVGGVPTFSFRRGLFTQGSLGPACVCAVGKDAEMHFAVSADDVYVHNGQQPTSVVDRRVREWLFRNIDPNYTHRSFAVYNPRFNEVWFCFPESGATQPTQALIWNAKTGAIGLRDLLKTTTGTATRTSAATQGTPAIALGQMTDPTDFTCDIMLAPANSYTILCNQTAFNPTLSRLLMLDRSAEQLTYLLDNGALFDDVAFEAQAERLSLTIAQQSRSQQPMADLQTVKLVTEVWPRVIATVGTVVQFSVGAQEKQESAIVWTDWEDFTVGTDEKIDPYISGRLLGLRMRCQQGVPVLLTGYELVVEPVGEW